MQKPPSVPIADKVITDRAKLVGLYRDVLALQRPSGGGSCSADLGPTFRIVFRRLGHVILQADAEPFGCRIVRLQPGGARHSDCAFWRRLADVLGAPLSALDRYCT